MRKELGHAFHIIVFSWIIYLLNEKQHILKMILHFGLIFTQNFFDLSYFFKIYLLFQIKINSLKFYNQLIVSNLLFPLQYFLQFVRVNNPSSVIKWKWFWAWEEGINSWKRKKLWVAEKGKQSWAVTAVKEVELQYLHVSYWFTCSKIPHIFVDIQ